MANTPNPQTAMCRLDAPAAQALADLAAIFDDLRTVLRCCERLMQAFADPSGNPDDLLLEAVWTTAVLSYARCFTDGRRGVGLTEQDLAETSLQGDVVEWHRVLRQLGKHYADPAENPREWFSVGAVRDSDRHLTGIALTSSHQPRLDDVTVRQTGALAYELSRLVDQRIARQQERVLAVANAMSGAELDRLPLIDVTISGRPEADGEGSAHRPS